MKITDVEVPYLRIPSIADEANLRRRPDRPGAGHGLDPTVLDAYRAA